MTPEAIRKLLERLSAGEVAVDEAMEELKRLPFVDLGFARVDSHRELRGGIPEVIFGEGKRALQVIEISRAMIEAGHGVFVTRLDAGKAAELCAAIEGFRYDECSRTARYDSKPRKDDDASPEAAVAVVSAGTSDQPVSEEAAATLEFLGIEAQRFQDVGVAGIHRLLADQEAISRASVAIVVAGMEGALPSVVGGLVDLPVIAVPTSIGYGASFGGLAALLGMMNSCAAGVTVVNIDNGFGAAAAAAQIIRSARRSRRSG